MSQTTSIRSNNYGQKQCQFSDVFGTYAINSIQPKPIKLIVFTHSFLSQFNQQIKNTIKDMGIEMVLILSDQCDEESEHYRDIYDDHIYPVLYLKLTSGEVLSQKGILSQASLTAFLNSGENHEK